MIGVSVRGLSGLKLLQPIIDELHKRGEKFIVYYYDVPRGAKEYDRASKTNIKKTISNFPSLNSKSFKSNSDLINKLKADGVKKLLGVELGISMLRELPKLKGIKTYSIQYLIDSMHNGIKECVTGIDTVYYNSEHIMAAHLAILGLSRDPKRDKFIGHPMFDPIAPVTTGDEILVMLPNIRAENAEAKLGSTAKFEQAMKILASNHKLIYKTRRKQWIPPGIRSLATETYDDGDIMYPTKVSELLKRSCIAIQAFSGAVYECVYGGNYTINLDMPTKFTLSSRDRIERFSDTSAGGPFNFDGVVENVSLDDIINGDFQLEKRKIIKERRDAWVQKFIGPVQNGVQSITNDLINS